MILAYTTEHKLPGLTASVAVTLTVRPFMRWSSAYTFIVDGIPKLSLPEEFWKQLEN